MITPLLTPEKRLKIGNQREEFFRKILSSTDFTKTRNDLEAVQCFFSSLWPTMERLLGDNEILLEEQGKVLKKHADLDEAYKLLVIKYESIIEQCKSLGIEFHATREKGAFLYPQ